jgi:L-fuconolactonase
LSSAKPAGVRVDAHQHFWDPALAIYPWMTDDFSVIRRAYTPEDLRPALELTGIEYTVLVQTRSSLDETREFLRIASEVSFVAGVVGWVDLTAPDVAATLAWLKQGQGGGYLVGVRHQVHDEADPNWLDRPEVRRGLVAVGDAGLTYDLLLRAREIPAALRAARDLEELRFVVDHMAKPAIASGEDPKWTVGFREFSRLENAAVKVSGIVTEAHWHHWERSDLQPYVDITLETFGPSRMMFGSDWPVCLLATTYANWFMTVGEVTSGLTSSEVDDLFGGSARRAYRLNLAPK